MNQEDLRHRLNKLRSAYNFLQATQVAQLAENLNAFKERVEEARIEGAWQKRDANLFTVLGCSHNEQVHSNLLAWLLDPDGSHGIGAQFLRGLIKATHPNKMSQLDFRGPVTVHREKQIEGDRPDLVVLGKNWILLIENKIRHYECEAQTVRYASRWKAKVAHNNRKLLLVFLTLDGCKPMSEEFIPISYKAIGEILSCIRFGPAAAFLIEAFKDHISNHFEESYAQQ